MTTFGPYHAVVADVHDGDTLSVDVRLVKARVPKTDTDVGFNVHHGPLGVWLRRQSVRLFGCNAPELATAEGKAARDFLLTLVKPGDAVDLVSHGWDKYGGRIDGQVTLATGADLTAAMIAAGHAKAWDGVGVKPV